VIPRIVSNGFVSCTGPLAMGGCTRRTRRHQPATEQTALLRAQPAGGLTNQPGSLVTYEDSERVKSY
jgi:hypothetical protein